MKISRILIAALILICTIGIVSEVDTEKLKCQEDMVM